MPTVPVRTGCTPAAFPGSATPTTPASTASPPPPSAPRASTTQTASGPVSGLGSRDVMIAMRPHPSRDRGEPPSPRQAMASAQPANPSRLWQMVSGVQEANLVYTRHCHTLVIAVCTMFAWMESHPRMRAVSVAKCSIQPLNSVIFLLM